MTSRPLVLCSSFSAYSGIHPLGSISRRLHPAFSSEGKNAIISDGRTGGEIKKRTIWDLRTGLWLADSRSCLGDFFETKAKDLYIPPKPFFRYPASFFLLDNIPSIEGFDWRFVVYIRATYIASHQDQEFFL